MQQHSSLPIHHKASPGVKTRLLENEAGNPLTPGNVPWGARDLSREIGKSGKIDTQHGGIIGKLRTGKLHTITAIAGKFYYYIGKSFLFTGH